MSKCLIIGGGIAGLTAASILSSKNNQVVLLEASPKLGGRTYSFLDKESGEIIDNGQHILMGCYNYTLDFIRLIGAENNFIYQKNLEINFISNKKKKYLLKARTSLYPINLLLAIVRYDILSASDKLKLISFLLKLLVIRRKSLEDLSVYEWLIKENQTENIIKSFWEILCVGAMNTNLHNASATLFYDILNEIFSNGNFASTIILPKYGLSESFINPALTFIKKNSGKVLLSEQVKELVIKNDKVVSVNTELKKYNDFDFVITAVPLYALEKIIPNNLLNINVDFSYSTILNIHLWLKENPFKEKFYGLIDSPLHWIFNKGSHINIVISDANKYAEITNEEIIEMTFNELHKYTDIKKEFLEKYKIIKEKRATFIPHNDILNKRPETKTKIKNLFLAGDWTNTDLPATIEGAAKSGKVAAELVLEKMS